MRLTLNDDIFEVDIEPLKARAMEGITNLISAGDTSPTASMMRQTVKGACTVAMSFLNIQKANRNDDPIQIMSGYIAELIFKELEKNGLSLTGEKQFKEEKQDAGNI